jgi:quinohemoprotein ethanol dehydrogenase
MPAVANAARELPLQPSLEASAEEIGQGKALYGDNCKGCHGANAVARALGSVPDLRYSTAETHRTWSAIVVGGARRANGMPAFELTLEEADAIRAWVLSRSNELRDAQTAVAD